MWDKACNSNFLLFDAISDAPQTTAQTPPPPVVATTSQDTPPPPTPPKTG